MFFSFPLPPPDDRLDAPPRLRPPGDRFVDFCLRNRIAIPYLHVAQGFLPRFLWVQIEFKSLLA